MQVGGEDAALVTAGEQVVQGDEPELARVARGPGDDHALRIEQRIERRHRATSTSTSASTAIGTPSHTMSGLTSIETTSGCCSRTRRQREQHVGQLLSIDRRLAAELAEQLLRREVVDELERIEPAERYEAERDVGDRLGEDPADAEHHGGPELRVAHEPGDELTVAAHLLRDDQVDLAVIRCCRGEQRVGRLAHRIGRREVEAHQTALGLVRDAIAVELHDDRHPHGLGGCDCGRAAVDDALVRDLEPMRGQQRLRPSLGQRDGLHERKPIRIGAARRYPASRSERS